MGFQEASGHAPRGAKDGGSGEHPCGHIGQVVCFAAFMAVWIVDSFILRLSTFPVRHAPLPVRLAAAGLVLALAAALVQGGHRAVSGGRRGLIQEGAFGRLRHPLYAGSMLFYLSLVLSTLSLISLAMLGGVFAFYDRIAAYEEMLLAREYGPEYQEYRRKVPKWMPRLRKARAG